jgi:molecular chaperone Hsp33
MQEHDCLRRFLFEESGVRGEWVRLQHSWQQTKVHQNLIAAVESQLGQALAAVALLSATLKYKGALILQAQGEGALEILVAHASHHGKIKGLARYTEPVVSGSLAQMMGRGRLVLTIESENALPYQGVVSLEGDCLAHVLETYFRQSEQLPTRLWLFANETYAAGLLLQKIPTSLNSEVDAEADWQQLEILAHTVTEAELFHLNCDELLYRLFHQHKIRLFDAELIEFACHCSRERIEGTLLTLGQQELNQLLIEREIIEIGCEFCGQNYLFNSNEINALFKCVD